MLNNEKLARDFINTVEIPKDNLKKQIIIAPVGVVAAGKTTTMRILKSMLPLVYINHDEIRLFLKKRNAWGKEDIRYIAPPVLKYFLKLGKSVIMDGDFVKRERRKILEKIAENFNVKVYYFHIIAPEDFIIRKLIDKKWSKSGLFKDAVVGIKEYFRRKPLHQRRPNIKFSGVIDASKPIKSQLLKIIKNAKGDLLKKF